MIWQWYSPTRIIFGKGAVIESSDYLREMGKKALIMIGAGGSARQNGALKDVCSVLDKCSIEWDIFDQVEANPSVNTIRKGAQTAKMMGADIIIGIGGGSPLDAAKAAAVLAVNDLNDEELFDLRFSRALPVVAVPTTAGTGSEVTPYSILTYPEVESKKSVASSLITPVLAAVDPEYTRELPWQITVDTAVDAFTHAFEGYLSLKSSLLSDAIAREALSILGKEMLKLADNQVPADENRYNLLYASTLAGWVISQTGTSIPHALGYSLTYFKNTPHGRANGILTPAYARFNIEECNDERTKEAIRIAGFDNLDNFTSIMRVLCGKPPLTSVEEIERFTGISSNSKNVKNNVVIPTDLDLINIYQNSLLD